MDNNQDINDALMDEARIMSFLCGEMTSEEDAKFKKDLALNPQLKENAINLARLAKGFKQVGIENDRLLKEAFLSSNVETVLGIGIIASNPGEYYPLYEETADCIIGGEGDDKDDDIMIEENRLDSNKKPEVESKMEASKKPLPKVAVWLSIAASIILIAYLGIEYISYRFTTGLGEEYCTVFSSGVISRGQSDSNEAEKKLATLFTNVQNKDDMGNTIHKLSLYWELSRIENHNDYTNYSAEIGWNLAIAHLKDNDKDNAKKVLQELIQYSDEDSVFHQKAKELLNKL